MNSFFGGSSSSSSSSSRRGKKSSSNAAEKPKQPQRGLGVAQLEKIRLHSLQEEMRMKAYAAMQSPTTGRQTHQSQDFAPAAAAAAIPYGNYQPHYQTPSAYDYHPSMMHNPNFGYQDSYCYTTQAGMNTRHFLNNMQDPRPNGSPYFESGLSSGSGDNHDVDLELKL